MMSKGLVTGSNYPGGSRVDSFPGTFLGGNGMEYLFHSGSGARSDQVTGLNSKLLYLRPRLQLL